MRHTQNTLPGYRHRPSIFGRSRSPGRRIVRRCHAYPRILRWCCPLPIRTGVHTSVTDGRIGHRSVPISAVCAVQQVFLQ